MGRPPKPIDAEQVFKLARLGCTQQDIADFFGCDEKTIRNRFSEDYRVGKEAGKISLRHLQWKRARAGSDPMLIHLGKTTLGQTDRLDVTSDGNAVQPIFRRVDNARDGIDLVRPPAEANGVCHE